MLDASQDFVAEAHLDGDLAIGFHRAQGIGALNVVRIVDDDNEVRSAPFDGNRADLAQELHAQAEAEIFGDLLLAENL